MRKFVLALVIALMISLPACAEMTIVASLFPQFDFARTIAGDKATVSQLLPPGMDSHSYEPSMKEIIEVSGADMFIYTGEMMEPWAASVVSGLEGVTIVDASEGVSVELDEHEEHEEHEHSTDAHIWLNPQYAIIMCENISRALETKDPANALYYKANAEALIADLNALDQAIADTQIDHTLYFAGKFAYAHFFNRYGFRYETAYSSCSSESEPSARAIVDITDHMKADGAKALYVDELCDMRVADSIASETGAEIRVFHTCHNVTEDELAAGETYLTLMYQNLRSISE